MGQAEGEVLESQSSYLDLSKVSYTFVVDLELEGGKRLGLGREGRTRVWQVPGMKRTGTMGGGGDKLDER